MKNGVLRNFSKFTGKNLCQSLFLIKLQAWPATLLKKETLAHVFSCEFCEISKNTFFTEHVLLLLKVSIKPEIRNEAFKICENATIYRLSKN